MAKKLESLPRIRWQFDEFQQDLIQEKSRKNRLYFAVQLKHYETHLAFCEDVSSLSSHTLSKVAQKLGVSAHIKPLSAKTTTRYRQEIRKHFHSQKLTVKEEVLLENWLREDIFPHGLPSFDKLMESTLLFLKKNKIEAGSSSTLERLLKSFLHHYEEDTFKAICSGLNSQTTAYLDGLFLLRSHKVTRIAWLQRWPGGASLKTILREAEKLEFLNLLEFPQTLNTLPQKDLLKYYRYISNNYPHNIKKMPDTRRHAFLAIFAFVKQRQVIDHLVELLSRLTKKCLQAGEKN